ncbi:MAG: hypothetical protein M0P94_00960 [Candidatus Absconditabacterales bacterium]|nr:hypothetical protein [Candidatus Absconditabacterales bacterium]
MNKKDYLIKLLEQLSPVRSLAKGFKIIVEQGELQDSIIDMLIEAIMGAIHTVKEQVSKDKLEKGLIYLQKIQNMEKKEDKENQKELEEIEEILENF